MILNNFIVFEGIDGSGTTTQLKMLQEYFSKNGKTGKVFFTKEPTDGGIGKLIRKALGSQEDFSPETMARLFAADRCEHLYGKEGIISAVNAGKLVFSDRYLFSGLAYQTIAGAGNSAKEQNKDFPMPEVLFFFDLPVKTAMQRIFLRAASAEIYEKESFQKEVRAEYEKVIGFYEKKEPSMTVVRINAENSAETIHRQLLDALNKLIVSGS